MGTMCGYNRTNYEQEVWQIGRVKKSTTNRYDAFFTTIHLLKHDGVFIVSDK